MTTSSKPGDAEVTSRESSGLLPDGLINAEDEQGLFTHLEWRNMGCKRRTFNRNNPGESPECQGRSGMSPQGCKTPTILESFR